MNNYKLSGFDRFVFWFIVIDNLFLPYFWLKCVSYSFPFIFLWRALKVGQTLPLAKETRQIAVLAGISTLLGCIMYPTYLSDNLVLYLNMLNALFSLQLFLYIRNNASVNLTNYIHKIFALFIIVVFGWVLLFFTDFSLYDNLKHLFNNRIEESTVDIISLTIRFGYFWSDENNIGYMTCAVLLYLSLGNTLSLIKKCVLALMTIVIVIATMSSGATIALGFTLLAFLYTQILKGNNISAGNKILVALIIGAITIYSIDVLLSTDVYHAFSTRIEGKSDGQDGRSDIYKLVIEQVSWWKYLFWGYGGRTIVGDIYRSTHNGVLHLAVAYGMIATWIYCRLYFFKKKNQNYQDCLWKIPVLMGFMINIMITEDKIHIIMMIMLAFELFSKKTRYI